MTLSTGFITGLALFLFAQLLGAVAWASAMNTKMDFMLKAMTQVQTQISTAAGIYSTKAEVSQALIAHEKEVATANAFMQKELAAMWKRIDNLQGAK